MILAYDITQHDTFAALPRWYDDVRKYAGDDALILLIGTPKFHIELPVSMVT